MDDLQLRPLTVDFHEPGFAGQIADENNQPFWFQMSDEQRQQAGSPWGPANPQALNRYSYVQGNPLRYTDPKGHDVLSIGLSIRLGAYLGGSYTFGLTIDTQGNYADFSTTSGGVTVGAIGGLSLTASETNADTIYDTRGSGLLVGVDTPLGSAEIPMGAKKEYAGSSFSLGPSAGADIHVEKTDTSLGEHLQGNVWDTNTGRSLKQWTHDFQAGLRKLLYSRYDRAVNRLQEKYPSFTP